MTRSRAVGVVVLALLAALVVWLVVGQRGGGTDAPEGGSTVQSETAEGARGTDTRDWDDIGACADQVLPEELEPVIDDIEGGGPYEYPDRDGSTFGNREGFLPDEDQGYYQEFTVETPGLSHRGAKRVVTGGGEMDPADGDVLVDPEDDDVLVDPEVWYYTDDHYESFCEFAP
ncbi:ribonuclease domain-containing protein [Ornithinimicrobium sp. LYQ92]|uniref:ribonuclease domain-containing protein n=1 Tax=Serinicoccus sp. LYQ92 TaxID=3378798 RepID=UPI00385252B1